MLSSKVSARKGIDATQIGSESSPPCTLAVGLNALGQKEIERVRSLLDASFSDKGSRSKTIAELQEQLPQVELKIGELAQIQDRGSLERKDLEQQLETARKLHKHPQAAQLEGMVAQLDEGIKQAEKDLEEYFRQQEALKQKLSEHRDILAGIERRIEALNSELDAINEWLRQNREDVGVTVRNIIHGGTRIRGDFATVTLKSDLQEVFIKEVKSFDSEQDPDSSGEYRMEFFALI